MDNERYTREARTAWGAVLAGAALAGVIWNKDHLENFVITWVPQAIALAIMFFLRARPAAIAGAALAFAGYLAFFRWSDREGGLAWLVYLFSLPGGLLGGIVGTKWLRERHEWSGAAAGLATAALVTAGLAIARAYWIFA